jgi:hypothetical protein
MFLPPKLSIFAAAGSVEWLVGAAYLNNAEKRWKNTIIRPISGVIRD